jgi:DNA-binding beta-propeller fold protein YncE
MMTKGISLGLVMLLVGCAVDPPARPEEPIHRLDLRLAMKVNDANAIGLAIASDGTRFVFDEYLGLLRIDGNLTTSIVSMAQMPTPDKPIRLPVTDLVALAPNLFAMTALGDGFLLDTAAMTLTQHFCYVPDGGDGFPSSITQRTDAIAYDAVADKLYAQPLTFDAAGELQYAQVARYNRTTGVDEIWNDAPVGTAATGSVFVPDIGLVLGQGAQLSKYDFTTREVIALEDLTRFGVLSIDGLAIDPVTNTLVVVDSVMDAVFDIDLALISL